MTEHRSSHVQDELPLLLTGEADRSTAEAVAAHLGECEQCRQALTSVVMAFAALGSAQRFAPQFVATPSAADRDEPALPDLSATFARIEAEAAETAGPEAAEAETDDDRWPDAAQPAQAAPRPSHARPRRRRATGRRDRGRIVAAALAAAACIALGAGVTYAIEHRTSAAPTARVVQLSPFGIGTTSGTAKVGSDRIQLDASSLAPLAPTRFYQAWLTNAARTQLLSLGPLGPAGTGSYTLPAHLIATYSAIEISVQTVNGNPAFSGISVLRGNYR